MKAKSIALEAINLILRCTSSTAKETDVLVGIRRYTSGESRGYAKILPTDRSNIWVGKSSHEQYPSN
jgi:hypothetical protein